MVIHLKAAGGDGRQCSVPTIRDDQGQEFSTNEEKAAAFGRFFSAKCSLMNDLQPSNLPNFPSRCTTGLNHVRFRPTTIARLLRQLDPSKATGPDGVPARVLKICAAELASPLSRLFSACFRKGVQPSLWKTANVVPIHKKQTRSTLRNYRPVSLLSVISKVMEKVINTTLMNHLEKQSLLSPHQFGFRPGLSAADLLTSISHQWQSCINAGGAVRALAVDIAGAFDKVSHLGVLHKLRSYGIAGTLHQWLTSYLTDRTLQAVVGGATSPQFPVTAGVPQGSILGPTLFVIYVNDAAEVLPCGVVPATYADDTTLFSLIPSADHAATSCATFQTGTDALAEWGSTWRIQFEPTKSQAMTISRHRHRWPITTVSFGGQNIKETDSIKLLGVTFDRTMSFRAHVRSVAMRAARRLGFLRKACHVLDISGRLTAYKGFVRPLMEYSPLAWGGAAPHHLSQLDKIQRRALALIDPGVVVDSLSLRRTISGICFIYKLMCGPRVPCLQSLLPQLLDQRPSPRTRQQVEIANGHDFQLSSPLPPRSHNTIRRSFPHAYISTWNSLPPEVIPEVNLKRLQQFKSTAYKHLLRNNWLWATQAYR